MHSLAGQLIGSTIVEDKGSLPFLRVFQQFIFFRIAYSIDWPIS